MHCHLERSPALSLLKAGRSREISLYYRDYGISPLRSPFDTAQGDPERSRMGRLKRNLAATFGRDDQVRATLPLSPWPDKSPCRAKYSRL